MNTIKLNDQQLQYLQSFLDRTELRGREAGVFLSLVKAINEAEKNPSANDRVIPEIILPSNG
jgi:hypothetical protein